MTAQTNHDDSRRSFLKGLFVSAAATGAAGLLAPAAKARAAEADVVQPFPIGNVRIAGHVVGPVVMRGEEHDYLVFDAHETDRRGKSVGTGTAVIRLTECVAWQLRTDGDQDVKRRAADPSDLDEGATYAVQNSSWVADLIEQRPDLGGRGAPPLHHLIFTFNETHFECVVARYDITVHTGEFDELVEYVSAKG